MKVKNCILYIFAFLLFVNPRTFAQEKYINANQPVPGHPRILMLKGEEASIKKTMELDPAWMKAHAAILMESDRLLSVAPVERIKIGRRLLDKSREALRRILAY
ncbi:MAG: hypothetical protein ABIS01_06075 [Ferruginibacter sp.]